MLSDWQCAALCDALDARNVPAARVNSLEELVDDPQIQQQSCLLECEHPVAGRMRIADTPFKLAGQLPLTDRHAPSLGQHSADILRELDVEETQITRIEQREALNRESMGGFQLQDST